MERVYKGKGVGLQVVQPWGYKALVYTIKKPS